MSGTIGSAKPFELVLIRASAKGFAERGAGPGGELPGGFAPTPMSNFALPAHHTALLTQVQNR